MDLHEKDALARSRAADQQRAILHAIARKKRLDGQCDEAEERLALIVRAGEDGVAAQAAKILLQCGGRLRGQEATAGADAFRALIAQVRGANVRKGVEPDIVQPTPIDVVAQPVGGPPEGGGDTRSPRINDDPLDASPNFSGTGSGGVDTRSSTLQGGQPNASPNCAGTKPVDPVVEAAVNAPVRVVDPADEEDAEGYGEVAGGSGRVGKYFGTAVEDELARREGEYNAVENAVMAMGMEEKLKLLKKLAARYGPKRARSEEARKKEAARKRKVYEEKKARGK